MGTVTEIHDYMRLLWARAGIPHCPNCGRGIRQQTVDQMVDAVQAYPEGTRLQVLSPIVRGKKGGVPTTVALLNAILREIAENPNPSAGV